MTKEPPDAPIDSDPWDTLARYLAGESTPGEAEAVRRWLAQDPGRAQLVAALERSLASLALKPPAGADVEAAWRRVSSRLHEADVRPERGAPRWRTIGLRAAAAVALLVGATLVWRAVETRAPQVATAPAARTYTTGIGRTDSLLLPDGSRALLGPGSELAVGAGYGAPDRRLELKGEALFEVKHEAAHPFSVRAGAARIQDLGTTFTVRSDSDEVRVVVFLGSVELQDTSRAARGKVILKAGDRGMLLRSGGPQIQRAAATEDDLAWTRGRLVFDNAPLTRVAADLRRWYGIDLRVADSSLEGHHLTASFAGERTAQVLDIIALALGARVERRGDTAIVRATPGGTHRP